MLGPLQIVLINVAIFFGHYVIIATALNFQYGNAGIPNMSSNISVACGAYVVSSIVVRICIWIAGFAGLTFRPNWVYDNPYNVAVLNVFLRVNLLLSLALFLLSLALALLIGSLLGWVLASISGKLRTTYLMMFLLIFSDAGGLIAANNLYIAGGTRGSFISSFLSWYPGEHMLIVALSTLIVGIVCYFIIRNMQNSPSGRLMRAARENEWTLMSTGKNVTKIRREVMMFSSGIMAVTGVLLSFCFSFVQYPFFPRVNYTFWPWLMITIGGIGNNAGALVGVHILRGFSPINTFIDPSLLRGG